MTIGAWSIICGKSLGAMDTGAIIDLERVITEYAWRELKRDIKWYDCMKRNCFTFEVSWNFFEFDHKTTQFQLRTGNVEGGYREKKQVELFRTDFTNNTNKDQVYKLRTQRQTKAATAVAIQKGFTLKGNTNFKLKIPPEIGHFGVSASADGYLRVCRPRGETFEDTFTWQVDSDVTVEPKHVTNARLLVTEDELVADFEVRTLMRMPTGEAPIIVRRKNNKEIYAVMMISNLRDVFCDVDCKIINIAKPEKPSEDGKRHSRFAIEFTTRGILESVRWRNQKICLQSCPIRDFPEMQQPVEVKAGSPLSQEDVSAYPTSVLGKMLGKHTTGIDYGRAEREQDRGARAKKDLRFNIVPTVISDPEEETPYETPERLLTTLIQESMSLSGSPQKRAPARPVSQMQREHQHKPLTREPVLEGACAEPSKPIIIRQKDPEANRPLSPSSSDQEDIYKTVESACQKDLGLYSYKYEPPCYKDLEPLAQDIQDQPQTSAANISAQNICQTDHHYKSQVEHFYLRAGDGAIGYRPLQRDITLIAEEPEKERAANMSKQSSVQSEETLDDATESLDSGDSRRVSKVTSV